MVLTWPQKAVWVGLVVLSLACGKGDQAGGSQASVQQTPGPRPGSAAVPVKVEVVRREDISDYIQTNTTLEADHAVEVRSRVAGQVLEVLVEEGDRIQEGKALARLDGRAADLQSKQMQVAYEDAKRTFDRLEKMHDRNLASSEQYEAARAQVDRTRAQYEAARLTLEFTEITSPIAGVVTARTVEMGNMITANQSLFSVADFDPLLAKIRVPEKEIRNIRLGQGARIAAEAVPDRSFRGTVKMISPVVDPESGTVKVTVDVPEGQDVLSPGMFVSVFIITATHQNALIIPKRALVLEGGETDQVYVFEGGKVRQSKIQTGFVDNDRLEVLAGLKEGEQVITVGNEGLRPGSAVRLVGEGGGEKAEGGRQKAEGEKQKAGGEKK
ncbi:MAG: efflux RND transporter periplasmic adaptor subunit [Candidatus Latescibacteria bacterium]|nr:efflux RND transporter periplasmic adaptor subunit [Candidatus Latescibacterota bacterium]